ncbi:alpha/beta hydrolase [Patescibacteria group bacterium]
MKRKGSIVALVLIGIAALAVGVILYGNSRGLVTNLALSPDSDYYDPANRVSDTEAAADRTISYGPDDLQNYDLYFPENPNGKIIVHTHGGGWDGGDKRDRHHVSKGKIYSGKETGRDELVLDEHYAVAVINYRYSGEKNPEVSVRDQAQDVAKAVDSVIDMAGEQFRTDEVILMGSSAGGHLVALVASDESFLSMQDLSFDNLQGVVLLDPPALDLAMVAEKYEPTFNYAMDDIFGLPPTDTRSTDYDEWIMQSPVNFVSSLSSNSPEVLAVYSNFEPPIKRPALSYLNKLDRDKVTKITTWKGHMGTINAAHEKGDIRDGSRRSAGVVGWMEALI